MLPALVVGFMTVVHLVGWWTNAVRNAVGFGAFAFWDGDWDPPLGWAPWVLCALVGVVAGIGAAVQVGRASADPGPPDATTSVPPGVDATPAS